MTRRSRAVTMTKATAVVILILFSVSDVRHVDCLMGESLGKFLGSITTFKQVKIPNLLNQLCNISQGSNTTRRDACYGCFYRTSILPRGYPMLISMSTCANTYLNNTRYGHCQSYLRNATTVPNPRVSPTIIYCTFLECVRQVNKDSLLRDCVREAMRMFPRFNGSSEMQLAQLYVNTTACVLAKTRCSYTNPVTGALQDNIVNKLNPPSVNAILVNTDYDFNIMQLPFRYSNVDVCSKYRNIQQASWPGVAC